MLAIDLDLGTQARSKRANLHCDDDGDELMMMMMIEVYHPEINCQCSIV